MKDEKNPQLFCLSCSMPLVHQEIEGRIREVCTNCGWINYKHLKVGAGTWVEKDGLLLLLRRAEEPWKGCWNLPAGYVEFDETPSDAAERETLEETGLHVCVTYLLDAIFFEDDPRGNGLLMLYACDIIGGKLEGGDESSEISFFSPANIPSQLAGGAHDKAIQAWLDVNLIKQKYYEINDKYDK